MGKGEEGRIGKRDECWKMLSEAGNNSEQVERQDGGEEREGKKRWMNDVEQG